MQKVYVKHKNAIQLNNKLADLIKYTDEKMKEVSLKGWSLLSEALLKDYKISLNVNDIVYNEYNKPYLINNEIYFNISHSKDYIAIIIDNKECGIDIEYIDYDKNLDKIIEKVLSKKEQKKYKHKINKHKYFYKQWTKKEAYYKMQGTGIIYNQLNNNIKYKNIKSYILNDENEKYYISFSK